MHEVSEENAKAAKEHALISEQQGRATGDCGKFLQSLGGPQGIRGEVIEEHGKVAQRHARASQEHAKAAQKQDANSTEEYVKAGEEHVQEVQEHLKAQKQYCKIINERMNKSPKIMDE